MHHLLNVSCFITILLVSVPIITDAHRPNYLQTVTHDHSFQKITIVQDPDMYREAWDEATEVQFWRQLMRISPDSSLIYTPGHKIILEGINTRKWYSFSSWQRKRYLDKVRSRHGWNDKLMVAQGKRAYYEIEKVIPQIDEAVSIFEEQEVDPWYAQSILLIESPAKLLTSSAGAYGPFQLMKSIAIKLGLTVTEEVDERADLRKSAEAAAIMMKTICIPETKMILRRRGISYQEDAIWFRLMVMHVYHAGMGNVNAVLKKINARKGGKELIQQMWHTQSRYFQSASQNYSQLALASSMELDNLVWMNYQQVCTPPTFQQPNDYDYLKLLTMK